MKKSSIEAIKTVYFLQQNETPDDQLKELGAMDLTFEQMDVLRKSGYTNNGAY